MPPASGVKRFFLIGIILLLLKHSCQPRHRRRILNLELISMFRWRSPRCLAPSGTRLPIAEYMFSAKGHGRIQPRSQPESDLLGTPFQLSDDLFLVCNDAGRRAR